MKKEINYIIRSKDKGGFSIEELFSIITIGVSLNYNTNILELPHVGRNMREIIKNVLFISNVKGIIHVTGDVHYIAILPFKKIILTIHDIDSIIRGSRLKKNIIKLFWFLLPSLFVRRITVISEFSKKQLLDVIPWVKDKVEVIHNPVNPALIRCEKKFNRNEPVVLHIGTKENKNLINTIIGLRDIKCKLIIVGKLNDIQKLSLINNNIYYENYYNLDFKRIIKLYNDCDIVSFISLYEGFGMPIIEAQQVGRPVVTSNRGAIPEVGLDSVLYVDPIDVNSIQEGFKKVIYDENYRVNLINRGFVNVKRFQLDFIVEQYNKLYKEI